MAGFAAQASLRSKWGDLVDSGASSLPEPSEAITGLKNWLKQVSFLRCSNLTHYQFVLLFESYLYNRLFCDKNVIQIDHSRSQASIEVREAGKRTVSTVNAHSPSFLTAATKRFEEMVNTESSLIGESKELGYTVYSKQNTPKHQAKDGITILHFNDVYNVDSTTKQEPIGGASRFLTAVKSFADESPLVLFSGDAFSPSMLSFFTQGEEMVPVLNSIGTMCAVFGNHDFGEPNVH